MSCATIASEPADQGVAASLVSDDERESTRKGVDPLSAFRAVRAGGTLSGELLGLFELATNASTVDAERVGHLLSRLAQPSAARIKPFKVALLSPFQCSALEHLLRTRLFGHGLWGEVWTGGFGEHVRDVLAPESGLSEFAPELTVLPLHDELVFGRTMLWHELGSLEESIDGAVEEVASLVREFGGRQSGTLVINTVPLRAERSHALLDYRSKAALGRMWRRFNQRLLELSEELAHLICIDLESLLSVTAVPLFDRRLAAFAGMSIGPEALDVLAVEAGKVAQALAGRGRKCVALDLDNTAWGGILGDDGPNGVSLERHGPGQPFYDVQVAARMLQAQGVLIALCSKNDDDRVREVFELRDDFPLSLEHVVAVEANWGPKPDSIRRIAERLNLGVDSFVFLDDSSFERGMMRESAPEVFTLAVDEDPLNYAVALLERGGFNKLEATEEDANRTQMYRAEAQRVQSKEQFADYDSYLRDLAIEVVLVGPTSANAARFAQLSQRTNQFNLTTVRRDVAYFGQLAAGERRDRFVVGIEAGDRFGSCGLVGYVEISPSGSTQQRCWTIENLVFSCRVFSRGIEETVLMRLLEKAREHGVGRMRAIFRPSSKNQRFSEFYQKHGFTEVHRTSTDVCCERSTKGTKDVAPWIQVSEVEELWPR